MEKDLQKAGIRVNQQANAVLPAVVQGIFAVMASLVAAYGRVAAVVIKKMVARIIGRRIPRDVSAMEALRQDYALETLRILREEVSTREVDDLTLATGLLQGVHENWYERMSANLVYAFRSARDLLRDECGSDVFWSLIEAAATMLGQDIPASPSLYAAMFLTAYKRSAKGGDPVACPSCELFIAIQEVAERFAWREEADQAVEITPEDIIKNILQQVISTIGWRQIGCSGRCQLDPTAYETTHKLFGRGVVSPLYKKETQAIKEMVALAESVNGGTLSKAHKKALLEVIISIGQKRVNPILGDGEDIGLFERCSLTEEARKLLKLYIELSFHKSPRAVKNKITALAEEGLDSWNRGGYMPSLYPSSFDILARPDGRQDEPDLHNLVKYFGDGRYEKAIQQWPGLERVLTKWAPYFMALVYEKYESRERRIVATVLRYAFNTRPVHDEDWAWSVPYGEGTNVPAPLSDSGAFVASEDGHLKLVKLADEDPRVLFAGLLTDCCQHPGDAGEECAWHAWKAQDGAIWAVLNKKGALVAQSWAWVKDRVLVLDNVEALGGYKNDQRIANMYMSAADRLVHEGVVDAVVVGREYGDCDFTKLDGKPISTKLKITPPVDYTDTENGVWILAQKEALDPWTIFCKPRNKRYVEVCERILAAHEAMGGTGRPQPRVLLAEALDNESFEIYMNGRIDERHDGPKVRWGNDENVPLLYVLQKIEKRAYPERMRQLWKCSSWFDVLENYVNSDGMIVLYAIDEGRQEGWYAILTDNEVVDVASSTWSVDLHALGLILKAIEVYCEGEAHVDLRTSTSYRLLQAYMRRPGSRINFIEEGRWNWDDEEMIEGWILIED